MATLTAIAWLASTATVILAAVSLARRLDPRGAAAVVVHSIVISWSWIVGTAVLLGLCRRLSGWNLVLGAPAIALAVLAVYRRVRPDRPVDNPRLVARKDPPPTWLKAAWAALLAFWASHVVTRGLLEFQGDFDSLMYHTPLVDYWLRARSLYAHGSSHWPNPGNNEILGLWAVAPFQGDFLITLNNTPATLLLAFGALELAAAIGVTGFLRHAAAFAVVANCVVMNQLADTENDVAVAALLVAAANYGLRHARSGRPVDLVLFSASLGLLCGIKYYALGYASVVWCAITLLVAGLRGWRAGVLVILAGAAASFILGGYWYARNLVVSGTPLFPMGLNRSSDSLSKEYPNILRTTFVGNGQPEVWPLALEALWKMTGPAHLVAVIAAPATVAWLAVSGAWGGRAPAGPPERLALALILAGSGAVLAVTPMALEDVPGTLNHLRWAYTPARYGLSFLSVAILALALCLQDLVARSRRPLSWPPGAALFAAAAYQFAFVDNGRGVDWAVDTGISINIVLIFIFINLIKFKHLKLMVLSIGVALAAAVGTVVSIRHLSDSWDARFARNYDAMYGTGVFEFLGRMPPSDRPIRLGLFDYRCHPFFGARRQYDLRQPREVPSYEWLARYLHEMGVSLVVTRAREASSPAGWDAYRQVGGWAAGHPESFERLYGDNEYILYKFLR